MKKCLFTILSCLVCGLSLAQGITTIDGVRYYLGNGEAMIMEQDKSLAGNIVIPEKVSYNGGLHRYFNDRLRFPIHSHYRHNAARKPDILGRTLFLVEQIRVNSCAEERNVVTGKLFPRLRES